MSQRQLVVVGNPENRRVAMFCDAARRSGLPVPRVIAYEAILAGRVNLADIIPAGSLVRIESPGENAHVELGLIQAGAKHSRRSLRGCEKIGTGTSQLREILAKLRHPLGASPIFSQPLREQHADVVLATTTATIDHGLIHAPQRT